MELPIERIGNEDRVVQRAYSSQCSELYIVMSELLDLDWMCREAYFLFLNHYVSPAIRGT